MLFGVVSGVDRRIGVLDLDEPVDSRSVKGKGQIWG